MIRLAALARHGHTAAPAFNGLFYATVATIIPVLFLAIAVQGPAYAKLLEGLIDLSRRFPSDVDPAKAGNLIRLYLALTGGLARVLLAGSILLFGVLGEIEALGILYLQTDQGIQAGPIVLASAACLTLIAAAGPAIALARTLRVVGAESPADELPERPD